MCESPAPSGWSGYDSVHGRWRIFSRQQVAHSAIRQATTDTVRCWEESGRNPVVSTEVMIRLPLTLGRVGRDVATPTPHSPGCGIARRSAHKPF